MGEEAEKVNTSSRRTSRGMHPAAAKRVECEKTGEASSLVQFCKSPPQFYTLFGCFLCPFLVH